MSDITNFIKDNLAILLFYLPIGIIGIWRWSVWLIKKIISLFYRMPRGNFSGTLAIITPVYNEDPKTFEIALGSWLQNNPDEIIAVIDFSNPELITIFKEFQKIFEHAKLIVTKKPGKRAALADGIRASKSEIIALVDSDTIWEANIKKTLIGPFSDPELGGLVPRQDVINAKTSAQKIFKIHLANRYLLEFPFLATVSDALTCLSGRTAIYRRSAIENKLNALENEHFMGKQMISGDDKTLTNLIQAEGWKTTFLRDIKVYTTGITKLSALLKQELRWARNAIRSDVKILFSAWLWKTRKILLLHMLDKFIQPITLLLAPIYFIVSLIYGFWQGALIIFLWWLVSRTIKLYPYFRENPSDITILPLYIITTFATAVIRIYALFTLDQQGWITRWDKNRLFQPAAYKKIFPQIATGAVMFILFFAVFSYKDTAINQAVAQKQQANEFARLNKFSIYTPDLPRLDDAEIARQKDLLLQNNQSDPYGYYIVKPGDALYILRKKFNIASNNKILDAATKKPLTNLFLVTGQRIAINVNDLRTPLTKNVLTSTYGKFPRIYYEASSNTIFVKQGGSIATLTKIKRGLSFANRKLLEQTAPGQWTLRANLYIGKNVTLSLSSPEVSSLKLLSDPNNFIWIRSESGNLLISETNITSWDETNNSPDYNHLDGRAYITAKNSGRMDIINSDLGYLGYVGLPKRGGAFGGSYGVSWKIKNKGFQDRLLTGVVLNSKFHDNYFGMYTYGATGMLINGNEFFNNIEYGLDPHDDSNNFLVENNQAYHNGNHGIIFSRRCFNNVIQNNISHDNRLHGIMLDRDSYNNLVQKNIIYGNSDGIVFYQSNNNLLLENEIKNNLHGIRLNAGSSQNYAENNILLSNSSGIYLYDFAQENLFINNQIKNSNTAITIKNASRNIFYDNFKTGENKRDGRITNNAYENNVQ